MDRGIVFERWSLKRKVDSILVPSGKFLLTLGTLNELLSQNQIIYMKIKPILKITLSFLLVLCLMGGNVFAQELGPKANPEETLPTNPNVENPSPEEIV